MIAVGHSSIGAMIGVGVAVATPGLAWPMRVALAFGLGIISHYPADWLPHGHYHIRLKMLSWRSLSLIALDVLGIAGLLLGIAWLRFGLNPGFWLAGVGIAGALAPDVFEVATRIGLVPHWRWVRAHHYFHLKKLHWHSLPWLGHLRSPRPLQLVDIWLAVLVVLAVWSLSR